MLRIAGQSAGSIGLNFLCGNLWVARGCYWLKNRYFFLKNFFKSFFPRATPGPSASVKYKDRSEKLFKYMYCNTPFWGVGWLDFAHKPIRFCHN